MQQLVWHVVALDHGLPSEKYGLKTAHRVLVVFEEEAALAAVLQRLLRWDSIHEHRQFILCSTIGRLQEEFRGLVLGAGGEDHGGRVVLIIRLSGDELRTQRPQVCFRIPPSCLPLNRTEDACKYRRKSGTKAGP